MLAGIARVSDVKILYKSAILKLFEMLAGIARVSDRRYWFTDKSISP